MSASNYLGWVGLGHGRFRQDFDGGFVLRTILARRRVAATLTCPDSTILDKTGLRNRRVALAWAREQMRKFKARYAGLVGVVS